MAATQAEPQRSEANPPVQNGTDKKPDQIGEATGPDAAHYREGDPNYPGGYRPYPEGYGFGGKGPRAPPGAPPQRFYAGQGPGQPAGPTPTLNSLLQSGGAPPHRYPNAYEQPPGPFGPAWGPPRPQYPPQSYRNPPTGGASARAASPVGGAGGAYGGGAPPAPYGAPYQPPPPHAQQPRYAGPPPQQQHTRPPHQYLVSEVGEASSPLASPGLPRSPGELEPPPPAPPGHHVYQGYPPPGRPPQSLTPNAHDQESDLTGASSNESGGGCAGGRASTPHLRPTPSPTGSSGGSRSMSPAVGQQVVPMPPRPSSGQSDGGGGGGGGGGAGPGAASRASPAAGAGGPAYHQSGPPPPHAYKQLLPPPHHHQQPPYSPHPQHPQHPQHAQPPIHPYPQGYNSPRPPYGAQPYGVVQQPSPGAPPSPGALYPPSRANHGYGSPYPQAPGGAPPWRAPPHYLKQHLAQKMGPPPPMGPPDAPADQSGAPLPPNADNGPSVTAVVTTGPDGAPLDEGSQQSTLSNASAASGEESSGVSGGKVSARKDGGGGYGVGVGVPAPALASAHEDYDSAAGGWSRTPSSPVFNSHVPQESYRSKKSDSLGKLYEMDDDPERRGYVERLLAFMEDRRTPITACPTISKQPLDLYRLYLLVRDRGGFLEVTKSKTWKDIAGLLGIGASSSAAYTLRKHYTKNLLAYECHFDRGGIDPQPIINQVEATTKKKSSKANSVPSPDTRRESNPQAAPSAAPWTAAPAAGSSNSQEGFQGGPGGPAGPGTGGMDGYGAQYGGHAYPQGTQPQGPVPDNNVAVSNPFEDGLPQRHAPPPPPPHLAHPPRPPPPHNRTGYQQGYGYDQYGSPYPANRPVYPPYGPEQDNRGYPPPPSPSPGGDPYARYGNAGGGAGPGAPYGGPRYPPPAAGTPPPAAYSPNPPPQDYYQRGAPPPHQAPHPTHPPQAPQAPQPPQHEGHTGPVPRASSLTGPRKSDIFIRSHENKGQQSSPVNIMNSQLARQLVAPLSHAHKHHAHAYQHAYASGSPGGKPMPPPAGSATGAPVVGAPRRHPDFTPKDGTAPPGSPYVPGAPTGAPYVPGAPPTPGTPVQPPPSPQQQPPQQQHQYGQWSGGGASSGGGYRGVSGGGGGAYGPGAGAGGTAPAWRPPGAPSAQPPQQWGPPPMPQQYQQQGQPNQWNNGSSPISRGPAPPRPLAPATGPGPYLRPDGKPYQPAPATAGSVGAPGPAAPSTKRELTFPPDSVEATTPAPDKRRRLTRADVAPVDPWRIVMALKSGLLAETCWALDVLNILLYDDSCIGYFGLQHMPGLLDLLLEHFQKSLSDIFDSPDEDESPWFAPAEREEQTTDLGSVKRPPDPDSRVRLLATRNYTNESRKGETIVLKPKEEDLFVLDHKKDWDPDGGITDDAALEPWQFGGDTSFSNHLMPCFQADFVHIPFARVLPSANKDSVNSFSEKKVSKRTNTLTTLEVPVKVKKEEINGEVEPEVIKTESVETRHGDEDNLEAEPMELEREAEPEPPRVPVLGVRDPAGILRRRRLSEYEDECYTRDEPSLNLVSESRDALARRCVALSNVLRGLTFVPGNETEFSRSGAFLALAGKLLLLHHEHSARAARAPAYERAYGDEPDCESCCSSLRGTREWWWDTLARLREDALVCCANIGGQVDLDKQPEAVARPLLDGLLHWAVCPAAAGEDALPCAPDLSPRRLALEALCKLCVTDANADLVLATPPRERLKRLCSALARDLCRADDQVLRELAVNLLHYLSGASSGAARVVALQAPAVSQLVAFIERAEAAALSVANAHGVGALRDNPEAMGTSLDMLRRVAATLLQLARHPDNRALFLQQERRLLSLVMSQILDQKVAAELAKVLFQCSRQPSPRRQPLV